MKQEWYCDECRAGGFVVHRKNADLLTVARMIYSAHRKRWAGAYWLKCEADPRAVSAPEARVHPATGAVGNGDHSDGTPDSRGESET